jgi:hypothetical protein
VARFVLVQQRQLQQQTRIQEKLQQQTRHVARFVLVQQRQTTTTSLSAAVLRSNGGQEHKTPKGDEDRG